MLWEKAVIFDRFFLENIWENIFRRFVEYSKKQESDMRNKHPKPISAMV